MIKTLSAMLGILLVTAACGESLQSASLTTPPPAAPPPIRGWMVFFETNSTALSEQANMTVRAAADVARASASSKVEVSGFTDTEGSVAVNQALSVRRATAVRDALVRSGVPAQSVRLIGAGETGLLVPTPDQTRYPSNRRAMIVVQ
ncbi:MAG: OmpA family protein [Alphaproteobacteria bacterium]|nr:MAG: OmpA family protein [Alphaproteobacteria bacterium]